MLPDRVEELEHELMDARTAFKRIAEAHGVGRTVPCNASGWGTLADVVVATVAADSADPPDSEAQAILTTTCQRCALDRDTFHVPHTCERPDDTEKVDHVEDVIVGSYGFIISRARLAEKQPVLNYFTWEAFHGPRTARDPIAEGFARNLDEARKLARAVITIHEGG